MPNDSAKTIAGLNGRQVRMLHILRHALKREGKIGSPVLFKRYHDGVFNTTTQLGKTTLRVLNWDLADLQTKGLIERELTRAGTRGQKSACWITDRGMFILQKIYQIPPESEGSKEEKHESE